MIQTFFKQPIDAIQEWLTNWDPRGFFGDETLNLHITAHREQLSLMIEEAANELIQNEGKKSTRFDYHRKDEPIDRILFLSQAAS